MKNAIVTNCERCGRFCSTTDYYYNEYDIIEIVEALCRRCKEKNNNENRSK